MKKKTVSLDGLMALVRARYPFDEAHYPGFGALNKREQELFALNHALKHLTKAVGKIAGELEKVDHGEPSSVVVLQKVTAKLLSNTLNLAIVLGTDAETLAENVHEILRKP